MRGVPKVARTIGKIAGAVSSIARVIPGGQIVAAIAGAAAITAGVVGALTAKKPIARGNSSQVVIGANLPIPYTMGRAYIGGNLEHDIGYGGTVDGVPNPYAAMTFSYGIGPWQSFESFQADYAPIPMAGNAATGYYGGFLYIDRLLGSTPETRALAANWAGEPGWSAAHKMSGHAQAKWSWKFDKKGKVNAGGFPAMGVISTVGVQAYDPRQDSTYPGGNPAGTQRLADRSTWGYNANPALHAGSYAQGVYHNGKKVFGVDLGGAAIDWPTIVDWANVCDANGWTINGTIFEPGDKWNNLKLIAQAGSAEPAFTGGVLTFRYDAPRISLDTITIDDLADDELNVPGAANPEEGLNGIIPKYRSEANQWEMVQSDLISVPAYVTADGEERQEEYETLLVTGKDQAARLATYKLVNGREIPGIILPCKPRLFEYQIGDALTVGTPTQDIEGLAGQLCVIVGRTPNFERGTVTLELITETASKHPFALGQSGTAPPPPVLVSAEMRDTISFDASQVDFKTQVIGDKPEERATAGANLIFNGNAEQGTTDGWSLSENSLGVELLVTPIARSGKFGFVIQKPGGDTDLTGAADSRAIAVAPGERFFVSLTVLGTISTGSGLYLRIEEAEELPTTGTINASNSTSRTPLISDFPVSDAGFFDYVNLIYTVPADIHYISISIFNGFGGPGGLIFETGMARQADAVLGQNVLTASGTLLSVEDGADVTATAFPDIDGNTTWTIDANASGTITTGLPLPRRFKAMQGGVDVSSATSFAVTTTGLVAATVNDTAGADRGVVTLGTGTTGAGTISLTATFPNGAIKNTVIIVTVNRAAMTSSGGTGATSGSVGTNANFSASSFVAVTPEIQLTATTGGTINASFDASYTAAANVTGRAQLRVAQTSGGAAVAQSADTAGTAYILNDEAGQVVIGEATYSGLTPSVPCFVQGFMRRSSGTGTVTPTGTLTAMQ